jgi:AraC-like DNA-binding protein
VVQDKSLFFTRSESLPFIEMRSASRSTACFHTHSHDEFTFGVIDTGSGNYHNLNQRNHITRGTTVTINPGDAHSCNPDADEWSYRMLFVDTAWIAQLQHELFNCAGMDYLPFPALYDTSSPSFQQFDQLFELLLQPNDRLAAETILIDFLRSHFAKGFKLAGEHQARDNFHIRRVQELIMDQLDCNWSLDEFSEETGLSRYHLIRSFKDHYGQSPHAYQLDQRIKKAKALLQQGQSLSDTALQLGFSDQSHFQRNFKKRVAVTPKQYQSFFKR